MMANFDKLKPEDQKMALFVSTGHRQWHDSKLKSVDQLPEIDADFIVLTWDDDDETKEIVLRHGREIVFRQRTVWEYFRYFVTACRILKMKYGYHLFDVIPEPVIEVRICGDSMSASDYVAEMRRLIRIDCWPRRKDLSVQETEKRDGWKTYPKQFDE